MTLTFSSRGVAAPVASAVATAAVLAGALWLQHARGAWPFGAAVSAAPGSARGPEATEAMAGMPGMDAAAGLARVPIEIAESAVRDLGVRTEAVRRESLTETIQAVATVVPDESRISHVHTRVAGWVERLDVSTTGERVRAGQPLARIFSQELLSSQTEYLAIRRMTAASGLRSAVVAGGRTRLSVLGMSPAEIDGIERSGEPRRLVTVVAPRSGVVVNRGVTVGTSVDPSTPVLTIADLSRVWVFAEVPEAGIAAVRVGTTAQLEFPASGLAPFRAKVEFLYPTLTERTRTLRVRLSAANTGGSPCPGLYGTASFETDGPPALTVPRDAVVDTGRQQHVFVAVGDRFEPRVVALGVQLPDRVEVRAGLAEGELVVASGVFLLDSESRLRATGGAGGHNHGVPAAAPAPAPTAPPRDTRPAVPPPAPDPHAGHEAHSGPPPDPHAGHEE
jgi:membrane fusion protein, copper/silver efflux system